jgi:hypothetical protein
MLPQKIVQPLKEHLIKLKYQPTQEQEFKEDTIFMTLLFKRQLSNQLEMRVLTNMQTVILSDILLQFIFLNQVTILEQYKNY